LLNWILRHGSYSYVPEDQTEVVILLSLLFGTIAGLSGWITCRLIRGAVVGAAVAALVTMCVAYSGSLSLQELTTILTCGTMGAVFGAISGAAGGLVAILSWSQVRAELGPLPYSAPNDLAKARTIFTGE
jgi:hypothetical protein